MIKIIKWTWAGLAWCKIRSVIRWVGFLRNHGFWKVQMSSMRTNSKENPTWMQWWEMMTCSWWYAFRFVFEQNVAVHNKREKDNWFSDLFLWVHNSDINDFELFLFTPLNSGFNYLPHNSGISYAQLQFTWFNKTMGMWVTCFYLFFCKQWINYRTDSMSYAIVQLKQSQPLQY